MHGLFFAPAQTVRTPTKHLVPLHTLPTRFIRWLKSFGEEDVDGTPSLGLGTPSETAQADMKAQGAETLGDLMWLEVSLFLGRPAGSRELAGVEAGSWPEVR